MSRPAKGALCPPRAAQRVFIVDDEPMALSALMRVLKQEGLDARCFETAEEALFALTTSPPDCIISDYYMPQKDGLSFFQEIKETHPDLVRVLITGGDIDRAVKDALAQEVIHLLVRKPWHIDTIRKAVALIRERRRGIFINPREEKSPEPARRALPIAKSASDVSPTVRTVGLAIEDPALAQTLEGWLRASGFDCAPLSPGKSGAHSAGGLPPEILLVELCGGEELCAEQMEGLRRAFPQVPIVTIVDEQAKDLAISVFRWGATACLNKPLEQTSLESTLQRCLQLGSLLAHLDTKPELSAILEIQHAIALGMSRARLLLILLQEMIRYTQADSASVLLLESDKKSLRIAASYGLNERVVRAERVELGEGISGWVVAHNQAQMILGDAPGNTSAEGSRARERTPTVGMCLPMRGRHGVVGALCVTRYVGDELFNRDTLELGILLAGEVARALERMDDSEEQMNLERSLLLHDKLVTIGELAYGVAHEINNPLGFVNSNIASLQEYWEELLPLLERLARLPETRDVDGLYELLGKVDLGYLLSDLPACLQETAAGISRVLRTVSDLHLLSRDEAGEMELAEVNPILDRAVNVLWNQIRHKAELIREYGESLPQVLCFQSQLGQVFINLLYNAVQAVGKEGRITLRTYRTAKSIVVEVRDNGQGMEPAVLNRLFEPFFTTKPRDVGTGLGLLISKKIVERHGGSIAVQSTVGSGSAFRILLPVHTESIEAATASREDGISGSNDE